MSFYNSVVPDASGNNNSQLNFLGSTYASTYGQATSDLVKRVLDRQIFDAAQKQYFDMYMLLQNAPEVIYGDEFDYLEVGFDRRAFQATAVVAAGTQQTISITASAMGYVAKNMIVTYPNNSAGIVKDVNLAANTITVAAPSLGTLPAVAIGDLLSYQGSVDPDGTTTINNTYRMQTTKRTNYIQSFAIKQRFGQVELLKYQKEGSTENYLMMQKKRLGQYSMMERSNALWNGTKAEWTSAEGIVTKGVGGIEPTMTAAGSPTATCTSANLVAAFKDLSFATEYNETGATRFLVAAPRYLQVIADAFKQNIVRFTPEQTRLNTTLTGVDFSGTTWVFLPMKRFEDTSSFPTSFANRMYGIDFANIKPVINLPEATGDTLDRSNGSLNRFVDTWVSSSLGLKFNNPQSCFRITVS